MGDQAQATGKAVAAIEMAEQRAIDRISNEVAVPANAAVADGGDEQVQHLDANNEETDCDHQIHPFDTYEECAAARVAYTISVRPNYLQDYTRAIATWRGSIAEWSDHLPPQAPASAPAVTILATGAATPVGDAWHDGNAAAYALGYSIAHGPSGPGPWSEPVPVTKTAGAVMGAVPADAVHMATSVWIDRRIQTDATVTPARIVQIVMDLTSTSYIDTHP